VVRRLIRILALPTGTALLGPTKKERGRNLGAASAGTLKA
jgi:hypothetical protein